jgi:hypothetical protein
MLKARLFAVAAINALSFVEPAVAQPEQRPRSAIAGKSIDTIRLLDMMISNRDATSLDSYSEELVRFGRCKVVEQGATALIERSEGGKSCLKLDHGSCYWVSMQTP